MPKHPIIDLHCDLLSYLQMADRRSPFDECSRTSYDQMKEGGMHLQTLAISTTGGPASHKEGLKQIELLEYLLNALPDHYQLFNSAESLEVRNDKKILVIPAVENAEGLCDPSEPIESGLSFLKQLLKKLHHILYISLTWNGENRFGGGNGSHVGLKDDGKKLLDFLDKKAIAADLSHTSDFLADDIINYIDKHSLHIPIIASHSNMRAVTSMPRNLPDELAKEIIRRQGLIGLNFFNAFVGENPTHILKHIEHALKLGGEKSLCFGADFFYDDDFPTLQERYKRKVGFFPEISNSSHYPYVISLLKETLSPTQIEGLAHRNVKQYLQRV